MTSLSFITGNWNTAQTVTASAAGDNDSTNEQVTLTHTATGGDYGAITGSALPGVFVRGMVVQYAKRNQCHKRAREPA